MSTFYTYNLQMRVPVDANPEGIAVTLERCAQQLRQMSSVPAAHDIHYCGPNGFTAEHGIEVIDFRREDKPPPRPTLNPAQERALRAVVEMGTGVGINPSTARALERRGLVKTHISSFDERVKAVATPAGRHLDGQLRLLRNTADRSRAALEPAEHVSHGERCEECGLLIPSGDGGERYHTKTCSVGIALGRSEPRR